MVYEGIVYISKKLKGIVSNHEKGLRSKAYYQLRHLVQGNKKVKPKIDLAKTILPFDDGKPMLFYRIRVMDYVYKIEHPPMQFPPIKISYKG